MIHRDFKNKFDQKNRKAKPLFLNRYKEIVYKEIAYEDPADIIGAIETLDKERNEALEILKEMLG